MRRRIILDPQDFEDAPLKATSFGTINFRRRIPCAGFAGETCKRSGTLKGGKLWYCAYHAPRGSEG